MLTGKEINATPKHMQECPTDQRTQTVTVTRIRACTDTATQADDHLSDHDPQNIARAAGWT